jgi:hypothetical protein
MENTPVAATSVPPRRLASPDELGSAATLAREFGDWASAQLKTEHGIEIAGELDHPPEVLAALLESGRL